MGAIVPANTVTGNRAGKNRGVCGLQASCQHEHRHPGLTSVEAANPSGNRIIVQMSIFFGDGAIIRVRVMICSTLYRKQVGQN